VRITRLFYPDQLQPNTHIYLDKNRSAHLIRVLRTKIDTAVILFNGNGKQYQCKTLDTNPEKTAINVITEQDISRESRLKINLVLGISRNDRMELAIQKATELGVHKITPVTCERSNFRLDKKRQLRKLLHWQGIATSACEQSGRNIIPPIEALQTLADYTETKVSNQQNIFLYPDAQLSLKTLKLNSDNFSNQILSILIGSEAG